MSYIRIPGILVKLESQASLQIYWTESLSRTWKSVFLTNSAHDSNTQWDGKLWFQIYALQCGSHWSHVATEPLKCSQFNVRCAISVKYTLNFKDFGQFSSVAQSCPTLCDPMNCSTPGLPVHHQLPEFTQTWSTNWTCVSCGFCIAGGFFTAELLGKPP